MGNGLFVNPLALGRFSSINRLKGVFGAKAVAFPCECLWEVA